MNRKILIIYDDVRVADSLKEKLEIDGYEILQAENGDKGFSIFQKQKPSILVTGSRASVTRIEGLHILIKVKASACDTEVIIITDKVDSGQAIEALRHNASDVIPEPVNIEYLLLLISRAAEKYKIKKSIKEDSKHLELLLEKKTREIKDSHALLLQSEKLASIGQLAAGVAHEINNPIGFISSNLDTINGYMHDIKRILEKYRMLQTGDDEDRQGLLDEIKDLENDVDIGFIIDDLDEIFPESNEGIERVKKIISDLKDFAHLDEGEMVSFNINKGIESTLNIAMNELKYKSDIIKNLGDIPEIECYPQELNQVFLNLLVNAAHSIEKWGKISIKTSLLSNNGQDFVEIIIKDTGCGIPAENIKKIFDPFFTTKEVGKGTGLGLNISYKVIEKHKGKIFVESEPGKGTSFFIQLPCRPLM